LGAKKVLITGAAGRIGQVLRAGLKDRYDLRLMDRQLIKDAEVDDVHIGDVTDLEWMESVCAGVDAVVHLAGEPSVKTPWESVLETNIKGTYSTYEAARRAGANRLVFASSNHATGFYEQEGVYTTPEMLPRPDSLYGVSKAFGEDLGRFYVDEHDMKAFCLRIGTFQPDDSVGKRSSDRILSTWLSYRDTVQLVWRCLEAEGVSFGIYYGISGNKRAYWDIQNARRELGYAPEDDAERLA
jgi:nucleoside-diphosphate-sugar epimerase